MPSNNFLFYAIKIVGRLVSDFLWFPVWWYSGGLFELLKKIGHFLDYSLKSLNLTVWLKNIFVPMYGQRDFAGVIISVAMRVVQIIFRSIGFVFLLILSLAVLVVWLAAPPLALAQIIFQLAK